MSSERVKGVRNFGASNDIVVVVVFTAGHAGSVFSNSAENI
jgi:hypothetical protein